MTEVLLGVAIFTAVVLCLAVVILAARACLLPRGTVRITINAGEPFAVRAGGRLLQALADRGLHLPQACGGVGTCGLCRVRVTAGGGPPLPVEAEHLARQYVAEGGRLACQVRLMGDLGLRLPESILGARSVACTLRSTRQVGVLMKELIFDLPPGSDFAFRAGAFVQLTCPPFRFGYRDLDVPLDYVQDWDRMGLWRLEAGTREPVTRAYSLANHPGEGGIVMLIVRLAIPPPAAPPDVPPGIVSSWLFALLEGDEVTVAGPHGQFFAEPGEHELVFLGGGAGMAPMRSHVLAQLEHLGTKRKISLWYGARSVRDLFYVELFDDLARRHDNFSWTPALSEPDPGGSWDGATGFIHQVAHDNYLAAHPAPESCEYYLCGPPLMIRATEQMLANLGVPRAHTHCDSFGG